MTLPPHAGTTLDSVDVATLAIRLRRAITHLHRRLRQTADTEDLSIAMQSTLGTIERAGTLTLGELAAAERVSPQTMTRLAAKLLESGMIERTVDSDDRRIGHIRTTVDGKKYIQRLRKRRTEFLAEQLDGLPAADVARLIDVLPLLEKMGDTQTEPSV